MASIYFAASEIVILSVIFFTNGVIIIVIGKPIAKKVKPHLEKIMNKSDIKAQKKSESYWLKDIVNTI